MARRKAVLAVLAVVTAAVVVALAAGAVELPDFSEWIEEAPETLGRWTYAFAGAMAFLELGTLLGVPAPFEVGVVLSGAVAGQGEIAVLPLALAVWVCASIGESVNFATGRRYGRPLLVRSGPRFRVTPERLERLERHFHRRGQATVLVARFIPLARSLTPFVAGSSLMAYPRFLVCSVIGNAGWAAVAVGLGYAFYRSADEVAGAFQRVGLVVLLVIATAAAVVYVRRRRRAAGPVETGT